MIITCFLVGRSRSGSSSEYSFFYPDEHGMIQDFAPVLRATGFRIEQDPNRSFFFIRCQNGSLTNLLNSISARTGARIERG